MTDAEFRDHLVWYENGTLDAAARAAVERHLAENAGARRALELHRALVRESETLWAIAVDTEAALARTMARIRNEPTAARTVAPPMRTDWLARLSEWLSGFGVTPRLAGGFAVLVIAAQAALLGLSMHERAGLEREVSETRASSAAAEVGPFIRVSFRQDARELDVRVLLVNLGATLAGGPSQLGDYYLHVPRDRIDQALTQIRASQYVQSAELVARVPPLR